MRKILVGIVMLALTCAPLSLAWGQSAQQITRYQMVTAGAATAFLIDTATGRVWLLMTPQTAHPISECQGFSMCFHELDRLKKTDSGWASEIYPSKR
jgi:hypothetical protein